MSELGGCLDCFSAEVDLFMPLTKERAEGHPIWLLFVFVQLQMETSLSH